MDPQSPSDKQNVDDMTDIIGAQVDLIVGIKEASDLPKEYENIYAIYNMNFIGGDNIKVASFSGMSNRP